MLMNNSSGSLHHYSVNTDNLNVISVDISCCCSQLGVRHPLFVHGFFGAPIFSFLYTLLDPVPPPIYARCPAVLASPPRFPTIGMYLNELPDKHSKMVEVWLSL